MGLYRKFDYWKRKAMKKTYGAYVYKLFLNFMLLSTIGLLTWTGIRLFSHQMAPLSGSIWFILEFIAFIWLSRVVSRNSWRRPSLKLTVFSLLGIALVLTFAGVQPLSTYKDTAIDKITTWTSAIEIEEPTAEEPVVDLPTVDLQFDIFQDDSTGFSFEYPEAWSIDKIMRPEEGEVRVLLSGKIASTCNGELLVLYDFTTPYTMWFSIYDSPLTTTSLEEEGTAYGMPYHKFIQTVEGKTSQVYLCDAPEGVVSVTYSYNVREASSNDIAKLERYALHVIATYSVDKPEPVSIPIPKLDPIPVKPALRNPSWEELKAFLYKDDTDKMKYVFPTTVCQDFAEKLQENAKEAGWRCALVVVRLEGYPDWYDYGIPSNTEHALNAFETTDRGLVYIDCTRPAGGFQPPHMDTIVDVSIGKLYIPVLIFSPGSPGLSMGTIVAIESIGW